MDAAHPGPDPARGTLFPWLLAASLPFAWMLLVFADDLGHAARSNQAEAASYFLRAAAIVLPVALTAVRWRRIGRRTRRAALLACGAWALFGLRHVSPLVRDVRGFVPNTRVVGEMLREPRRAMRTPPRQAAERALAAGDTAFLATGGRCAGVPAVDAATARRHGVRVVSGTFHDGEPLTAEHGGFASDAHLYADGYNRAILERLGIEPGHGGCVDPRELRRGERFFWP